MDNEYDISKNMLNRLRQMNESQMAGGGEDKYINITDDPKFGQNKLSEQKNMVISALHSTVRFDKDPLRYYPETGDVVFMGVITDMNDTFFEFRLLSGNDGIYIGLPADSFVQLTRGNIEKLQQLNSLSKTWHESWTANSELLAGYKKLAGENQ